MESIYDPANFLSSEHINIKEYFNKFQKSLVKANIFNQSKCTKKEKSNDFSGAFTIAGVEWTKEQKKLLEKYCDSNILDVEGEPEQIDITGMSIFKVITLFKPYDSNGAENLITIQKIKSRKKTVQYKYNFDLELQPPSDVRNEIDLKPGENIIIYATIFRPFKYDYAVKGQNRYAMRFLKEIALLGINTLADFRDMINCTSDSAVCKEVSDNPDFKMKYPSSKEVYPSGFIFIDNVFYNDFRKSNAIDYSEVIRNWASSKKIADFTTADMVNTRIDSLTPRMVYPYLYQHKGCCEHIFIFTHMRILNSNDSLSSKNYPYYNCIGKLRDRYCIICGINTASWLVIECDRLPSSKAALCTSCFKSYNYVGNKKIGNFKAYPYYNSTSFM